MRGRVDEETSGASRVKGWLADAKPRENPTPLGARFARLDAPQQLLRLARLGRRRLLQAAVLALGCERRLLEARDLGGARGVGGAAARELRLARGELLLLAARDLEQAAARLALRGFLCV